MANRDMVFGNRVTLDRARVAERTTRAPKRGFIHRLVEVLLMFAVAMGIAFGIVKLSLFLGLIEVDRITVEGNCFISDDEVARLAGIAVGQNIEEIDEGKVADALLSNPRVMSVVVNKSLSGEVVIQITESIPVALIRLGDSLRVVDNHSCLYDSSGEVVRGELPLIGPTVFEDADGDGHIESEDLQSALDVLTSMRKENLYLGARLCYFDLDEFRGYTVEGISVVFAPDMSKKELVRASAIYRLAVEKGWVEVDARFDDRIIVDKGEVINGSEPKGEEG